MFLRRMNVLAIWATSGVSHLVKNWFGLVETDENGGALHSRTGRKKCTLLFMEASQQLLKHLSGLAFLACDSPLWLLIQKKVFVQFLQV
jgi:hypothetical protein